MGQGRRIPCSSVVDAVQCHPDLAFREMALNFLGTGELGRWRPLAESLNGNCPEPRTVLPKVMPSPWGQPLPTTTQCRGIKTQVLPLIWHNSEGPFQLQSSGQWLCGSSLSPQSNHKSTPRRTSWPQIPLSEDAYQRILAENPTLTLPLSRVNSREAGKQG